MRFKLFGTYDGVLLAGLTAALVVIFSQPLQFALDVARSVERTYQVALIPALVILFVVFILHQQARRQERLAAAAAAAAEAREAKTRAKELERLAKFGHALSRALEMDSLREVLWLHLPSMIGNRAAWLLVRTGQRWQPLIGATGKSLVDLETIATWVATESSPDENTRAGCDGIYHCVPLRAGDSVAGVLGIERSTPLDESEERMLAAILPVIAISVKNAQLFAEIRETSVHDALTGCVNRVHAIELLQAELRRSHRSSLPLSIVLFDLDRFKALNDRLGRLCGDTVLMAVGAQMRELTRASDVKARYGGEEFLLILPDTPLAGAFQVASWLREQIAARPVPWRDTQVTVTASFGVADALPGELSPTALIARADAALHEAKCAGRNCVQPAAHPDSAGTAV